MKKLNLMLVLLFCVICSLFAFVGCADNPDGNGTGTVNTEQTTPDDTQGGNTGSGDETEKPQQPSGGNILVVYFSCTTQPNRWRKKSQRQVMRLYIGLFPKYPILPPT